MLLSAGQAPASAEGGVVVEYPCAADTRLRSLVPADAAILLQVLDADRATFDLWLRWSGGVDTMERAREFIARAARQEQDGHGFHWGLWRGATLLGGIPCWSLDPVHRVAEIGYWLSAEARGTGLATAATRVVMEYLFTERGVNRVELQCRTDNVASRRVAERVGGQLEGVRRRSHFIGGTFRDHAVYAVLATDPRPLRSTEPGPTSD
jgi:RimJ/RimL family protein N-acetyltransferase